MKRISIHCVDFTASASRDSASAILPTELLSRIAERVAREGVPCPVVRRGKGGVAAFGLATTSGTYITVFTSYPDTHDAGQTLSWSLQCWETKRGWFWRWVRAAHRSRITVAEVWSAVRDVVTADSGLADLKWSVTDGPDIERPDP
jgi:hypothetical protein